MSKDSASTHNAYDLVITPDIAREWLAKNSRNRQVSMAAVSRLKYAMENGLWHFDGSPIRRDAEGNLLDGQHRLTAVLDSGKSILFHVIDGIDASTQATMDTGRKRSLADAFHMNGEKQPRAQAAIVQSAYRWYIAGSRSSVLFGGMGQNGAGIVQMDELISFQDMFRSEFEFAAEYADRIRRILPVPSRVIGLLAWLIVQCDREQAEWFLERLHDGAGLEKGSPILALRNVYIIHKGETTSAEYLRLFSLGLRAWNLFRANKSIVKLTLPQEVPEPR